MRAFDHACEFAEQIAGVVGSGGRFGVVLDGKDRKLIVAHTFASLIIEIKVRYTEALLFH